MRKKFKKFKIYIYKHYTKDTFLNISDTEHIDRTV